MFGLDSPLGLFPPGMDPTKMYNPLMDLPDHHPAHHRQLHPDHPSFMKKKCKSVLIIDIAPGYVAVNLVGIFIHVELFRHSLLLIVC